MLYVTLAVLALAGVVVWMLRRTSQSSRNWQERGEPRGRVRAEPEGTLHIKVTRKDGTVEDHGTVPAYRSK